MNLFLIGATIAGYFSVLFLTSWLTARRGDNATFFIGNRQSPWYIVAVGMVGASISGVTFISVPGWVESTGFTYMQMVFGYFVGYVVVANVLLPLYYRLNLISIYSYLGQRFGAVSYRTGALLFIVSRLAGSSARLFLMVSVLQFVLFDALDIPFYLTTIVVLAVVWLYTRRSGLRTIIFTDTVQTIIFLLCVVVTFVVVSRAMNLSLAGVVRQIVQSSYFHWFEWTDWRASSFFWKQFLSGVFITIVMTGLDQDMMQKNLSCKSLRDAKKNMYSYGFAFIPVNILFLALGALMYLFAKSHSGSLDAHGDMLYPSIVTSGLLPPFVVVLFILGLLAAALSSADSTLTSLTTSFSLDILRLDKKSEQYAIRVRRAVHIGFTVLTGLLIFVFQYFGSKAVIDTIFIMAGYTYGPLLGLYALGLFTSVKLNDRLVPIAVILAPVISFVVDYYSVPWFGFKMGYEVLLLNGSLTVLLLLLLSYGQCASLKKKLGV